MTPRSSFPMDAQNRAQDLAASILAATSPPQIATACSAVDAFLRRHASDQSRAFFSIAFPALLCRLFGFDDSPRPPSSSAWIDRASADPHLAASISDLLSPQGILLSSISSVDHHALVKYVFPLERLPEWMRFALQSDKPSSVLSDLCALFRNRVKEDKIQGSHQLQLNVFEYYMFWFAYYPVCRGNSEKTDRSINDRKGRRFRLENWTSSLSVLSSSSRRPGQKAECSLYLRLLYAYLRAFVPKYGLGSYQPYRSSLLHYSSSHDGSAFLQAEFLVHNFIHFWMVNNDFSPLPVHVSHSLGLSFPYRAVLGETPPTAGLGEVLKLLVNYMICRFAAPNNEGNDQTVYGGSPVRNGSVDVVQSRTMMVPGDNSFGSWNSVMQRPLYRFILRTFLFCPMGASIRNAAQVFSLWVTYMEPWKTNPEDFVGFDTQGAAQNPGSSRKENLGKINEDKEGNRVKSLYSPAWQSYVLSNYLFYSSLVVHFLGFAHKFLHANVESVIQMVSQVLNVLTSSRELLELLRKVDAAYHSKPLGPSSYSSDEVHKYVPSIREQLLDWEDGLCESDADGSFLHENWNHDLRLFSDGEDGAYKLLQLFVLRTEHEIQLISGDVSHNLQALDSMRSQMNILFGGPIRKPLTPILSEDTNDLLYGREVFTPKHPGVGKRTWADVKYKGDWMRRPISDTEVAWLARLLVRLSDWLNESLGLYRVDDNDSPGPTYVEVGHDEPSIVGGPKEALYMMLALIGSWLGLFGHAVIKFMRTHRMRINLRVLASKKFVMVLVLYAVVSALKKAFCVAFTNSSPV
ncbi:Sphingomyelin phosphodiesterase 4 [Cocos nucifera]|uniref:Sphingomyelin phosphodiesterase 4 n=1 Tax=Cocos nucifera TaxID=13894 RepID=A0A8K0IFT4_COCNU|nr:Sphingomyelin phosphodiesterase 4 [Cocos nucifera]